MPYRLIRGEFLIVGKQPDADSVQFKPDNAALFSGLAGRVPKTPEDGTQLRFQGVDAPELHYNETRQPVAKYARNVLLYHMGFGKVRFDGLRVQQVQNQVRGAIITRGTDPHGRPIAYLFLESSVEGLADGTEWPDGAGIEPHLCESLNYLLLAKGMVYYLAYESMPEAHRTLFRAAAAAARQEGAGVWIQDYSAEFRLVDATSIGPDGDLILPKLFRRCSDYLRKRSQENLTVSFTDWLRAAGPENDSVLVRGSRTTFADLIVEADGFISLKEDTLDLVFVEVPSGPVTR